jgi:hypothetical protein
VPIPGIVVARQWASTLERLTGVIALIASASLVTKENATALAFLVAPAATALPAALWAPLSGTRDVISVVGTFVVWYGFAALAALIAGLPAYLCFLVWDLLGIMSGLTFWLVWRIGNARRASEARVGEIASK